LDRHGNPVLRLWQLLAIQLLDIYVSTTRNVWNRYVLLFWNNSAFVDRVYSASQGRSGGVLFCVERGVLPLSTTSIAV
jgi:hypothetical protein